MDRKEDYLSRFEIPLIEKQPDISVHVRLTLRKDHREERRYFQDYERGEGRAIHPLVCAEEKGTPEGSRNHSQELAHENSPHRCDVGYRHWVPWPIGGSGACDLSHDSYGNYCSGDHLLRMVQWSGRSGEATKFSIREEKERGLAPVSIPAD